MYATRNHQQQQPEQQRTHQILNHQHQQFQQQNFSQFHQRQQSQPNFIQSTATKLQQIQPFQGESKDLVRFINDIDEITNSLPQLNNLEESLQVELFLQKLKT